MIIILLFRICVIILSIHTCIIAQNRDYIQTHCNDLNNPFHFACRQRYSYNNPGVFDQI